MTPIVTTACLLGVAPTPGSPGVGGVATAGDASGGRVRAGGGKVYAGQVGGRLSGVTAPGGYAQVGEVAFDIPGTSEDVLVDGEPACLEGDHADVDVLLGHPDNPPITVSMRVSVLSAGQTRLRGT